MAPPSNYPVSFYFKLNVEGIHKTDFAFQEVSGISKELMVEEVAGGGENRFKYKLPTIATSQNLVLKGALVTEKSPLITWFSKTLDNGMADAIETRTLYVSLLNEKARILAMWKFFDAYPLKYSISNFKSDESAIAIETMELAYTYFIRQK